MFWRVLTAACVLMCGVSSAQAGIVESYFCRPTMQSVPAVRVLIGCDLECACVGVEGKFLIVDPCTGSNLGRRLHGKLRSVVALPCGIKWGEEFPDIYQIQLIPLTPEGVISVNGICYTGSITLYNIGERISIVNELPIEDFVQSILASKAAGQTFLKEALAAAAITQRTEACYRSAFPRNSYWDIDAQAAGYKGLPADCDVEGVADVVKNTTYMVLNLPCSDKRIAGACGQIGLFPAEWDNGAASADVEAERRRPRLHLVEAQKAAEKGQNAAQILSTTFPGGVTIERMCLVD